MPLKGSGGVKVLTMQKVLDGRQKCIVTAIDDDADSREAGCLPCNWEAFIHPTNSAVVHFNYYYYNAR